MKTRICSFYLGTVLLLTSTCWHDAQATEVSFESAGPEAGVERRAPLRGGVSATDTDSSTDLERQNGVEVHVVLSEPAGGMGPELFYSDGTKSSHISWCTLNDGTLEITRMEKGPEFEVHNQNAWHLMLVGSNMEKQSAIARNNGDANGQRFWHERSLVQFANAKVELHEHLKLTQSGSVRVPAFYTLLNLSTCSALLGETQQSLQYYNQFLNVRERFWSVPHGSFILATLLLKNEELDIAKQLLLRTVGSDPTFAWKSVNDDPEYRVISWRLISEIDKRRGDLTSSESAQQQAKSLLQTIAKRASQNGSESCGAFVERKLQEIHRFGIPD